MGKSRRREKVLVEHDSVGTLKRHSREAFKSMPRGKAHSNKPLDEYVDDYDIYQAAEDFAIKYLGELGIISIEVNWVPFPVILICTTRKECLAPKTFVGYNIEVKVVRDDLE